MRKALVITALFLLTGLGQAFAGYKPWSQSDVDPELFRIDEVKYLGVKANRALPLIDEAGKPFTLGEKAIGPTLLVLSYYQCDGTCSVVNHDLKGLLEQAKLTPGQDVRVLTLSFDPADTPETLAKFRESLALPAAWREGWTLALPADGEAMKSFANSLGFKFFWSPRDKMFLHPGIYIALSAEGRVTRYLYSLSTSAKDLALAVTEAKLGQVSSPRELLSYAVGLCYSYNYAEGRYTLNIPLFVGLGSLFSGFVAFALAILIFRRRKFREIVP
jgi:protein SCO1/2